MDDGVTSSRSELFGEKNAEPRFRVQLVTRVALTRGAPGAAAPYDATPETEKEKHHG